MSIHVFPEGQNFMFWSAPEKKKIPTPKSYGDNLAIFLPSFILHPSKD